VIPRSVKGESLDKKVEGEREVTRNWQKNTLSPNKCAMNPGCQRNTKKKNTLRQEHEIKPEETTRESRK